MAGELLFVGWNHRGASLDLRERLAFTPDSSREALAGLFREGILSEGAIVSTCNRSEVYGVTELPDGRQEVTEFLSRFHGVDGALLGAAALAGRGETPARHLFRVASGLDSMVLGEAQILGQIRDALHRAAEAGAARSVTNRLFQAALECGKRVRTETALGVKPTSVAGIALSLTGRLFESLEGRRVLLIGAGETVELTARLLLDDGARDIRFCNRSPEKAKALAEATGGTTVPWEAREAAFADVDIVLSATGASDPVVGAEGVRRALARKHRRGPLLVLDLAVPRDVEPEVGDLSDVYRYDLDSLQALAQRNAHDRLAEVPKAEAVVEEQLRKFLDWLAALSQVDVVKGLREKLDGIRRQELSRYEGKLARLSQGDRELVDRLTDSIVSKILHDPTVGLKEGTSADRLSRAEAVKALFKLGEGPR